MSKFVADFKYNTETMIKSERLKIWFLIAVLSICGTASFASCASNDGNATEQSEITAIADKVWAFSQTHPDGFTINIRTMTEPTEGIAVSYAATQNSYSCVPSVASELSSSVRDQLDKVVSHALQHGGYVSGWYNGEDGLYYFDSTKLFPENDSILSFHSVNLYRDSHQWKSSRDTGSRHNPLWYYR